MIKKNYNGLVMIILPGEWYYSYLTEYCNNDKENIEAYEEYGIEPATREKTIIIVIMNCSLVAI